ncbi:uncharacterized protein LOC111889617 [Lactuca sativa]|uniref:Uncharacterized protein n=1 Tax=Lactuca sativa TaxID=4236 RepID=A0A9R1XRR6_LACSA|nr:uncharacterized protein LOC111889617 [Lactuca sativa]KAJ0225010.1 hypothetical protein LSAT_V11C100019950 [Lactuca sativa]
MATNGGTVRDAAARRRRIAERGAERLALITGRAQSTSLSSSPLPPSVVESHQSSTAPCPPSIPRNPDQFPLLDEHNDSPSITKPAIDDVKNDVQITKTSVEASSAPIKTQSFPNPTTITEQPPSISTSNNPHKSKSQTNLGQTLTPNRLRPAITSSQNTRTYCSIIAALLVLLSYAGFPILGNNSIKYIILSRPLVLLLLTNITLVVAPVLLEKVNREGHRGSLTGEVGGFGDQLGMALEWGMLMKSGLSALFIDCSVYSVVVVCGMSFLKKFGW